MSHVEASGKAESSRLMGETPLIPSPESEAQLGIKPRDHWYGFVVAIGSFMVQFGVYGMMNSYSVFTDELEKDAALGFPSPTKVSFGNSLANGLAPFASIVAGFLSDRFGSRVVMFGGSLCCAIGSFFSSYCESLPLMFLVYSGLTALASAAIVGNGPAAVASWMDRRLPVAMGLSQAGNGAGSSVVVVAAGALAGSSMGWRASFRVMATFPLIAVVASLFITRRTPAPSESKTIAGKAAAAEHARATRVFLRAVACNFPFWVVYVMTGLLFFSFFGLLYILVPLGASYGKAGTPYAHYAHISIVKAATLFTWFGVTKFIGSIGWGAVAQRFGILPVYAVNCLVVAASFVGMSFCTNYAGLAASVTVCAFGLAGTYSTLPGIIGRCFDGPFGSIAQGLVFSSAAFGGFVAPPVVTALRVSRGGDYQDSLFLMAGVMVASGLVAAVGLRGRVVPQECARPAGLVGSVDAIAVEGTERATDSKV